MLKGNRCELCNEVIQSNKAQHKQTKYCQQCAKQKKKENTENSWLPEEKREYMRRYMRKYRRLHPKLNNPYVLKHRQKKRETSTADTAPQNTNYFLCLWFLPLLLIESPLSEIMSLWFDSLNTAIAYLELIAIKITGFLIVVTVCWQHIRHLLDKDNKNKDAKESKD